MKPLRAPMVIPPPEIACPPAADGAAGGRSIAVPETRAQPERALPFVLSDPNRGARSRERTSAPTEREGYFVMPSRLTVATPEQERWRELGLTGVLACLVLLIFAVAPLGELGVIGRLAAGVLCALPSVLAVLVRARHPAAL